MFAVSPFNFTAIAGEPDELARADGQHRRLEAGGHGDALGLLPDAALPGGRACPTASSTSSTAAARRSATRRSRARTSPGSTSPARRRSSTACGARSPSNMERYRNYPRIVGETGGKDFIVAHPSADVDALAAAIVRGSFEYQGQKCSRLLARLRAVEPLAGAARAPAGGGRDDQGRRRRRLPQLHGRGHRRRVVHDAGGGDRGGEGARRDARSSSAAATTTRSGYFVEPTVIETRDPDFRLLREEIFGPVVTTYVYDESTLGRHARRSSTARRRTG